VQNNEVIFVVLCVVTASDLF